MESPNRDLAEWRFGSGYRRKKKLKVKKIIINPVQGKNRAQPMAARLTRSSSIPRWMGC